MQGTCMFNDGHYLPLQESNMYTWTENNYRVLLVCVCILLPI